MPIELDGIGPDDWMPGDLLRDILMSTPAGRDYYPSYTRFIRERRISSVVEIGVRCGYSMAAMLRGNPDLMYLGIDTDGGNDGGIPGSMAHAEVLRQRYGHARTGFIKADSHTLTELPHRFDLGYIDGDHSTSGCLQDLDLCAPWCNLLLVDDVYHLPSVGTAVQMFCEARSVIPEMIDNYAGWAIIPLRANA
jgi:hypothetical protein